jgi:hypothetical protein
MIFRKEKKSLEAGSIREEKTLERKVKSMKKYLSCTNIVAD